MVQEMARKTANKMADQAVIDPQKIHIFAYGLELLYQTESSNMSASNVFSPKMNRKDLNNVDYWHTFSNYVPPYAIPYQTVVSAVDRMYLTMKRGSHSSSASSLYLTGAYNP